MVTFDRDFLSITGICDRYGVNAFDVARAARNLDALRGNEVAPSKLDVVLKEVGRLPDAQVERAIATTKRKGIAERPAEERELAIALGKKFGKPFSYKDWDDSRRASGAHEGSREGFKMPEGTDLIRQFGSWAQFLTQCGYTVRGVPEIDLNLQRDILQLQEQGRTLADIAKALKLPAHTLVEYSRAAGSIPSAELAKLVPTLDALLTTALPPAMLWSGEQKARVRDEYLVGGSGRTGGAQRYLDNPLKLRYFGLPAANLIDYVQLAKAVGIVAESSLIAEHDFHTANVLRSVLAHADRIVGGEIFHGLTLHFGDTADALRQHPDMRFNFVNLDYQGAWSVGKEDTLQLLFSQGQFDAESLLFLTLNDSVRERSRVYRGRDGTQHPSDSNLLLVKQTVDALARQYGYSARNITDGQIRYRDTDEMVLIGFRLNDAVHVDKVVEDIFTEQELEKEVPLTIAVYWSIPRNRFEYRVMDRATRSPLRQHIALPRWEQSQERELHSVLQNHMYPLLEKGYDVRFEPITEPMTQPPSLGNGSWTDKPPRRAR